MCGLVARVVAASVAPACAPEGVQAFLQYAQPESLAKRVRAGRLVLVATDGSLIVGMIEVHSYRHIALLFVDEHKQRQGIGRELLRRALVICRGYNPFATEMTVHALPTAVTAYTHFGFQPRGPSQVRQGIAFVPMARTVRTGAVGS